MEFKCAKCGKCCNGDSIIATIEEIHVIENYTKRKLDYTTINNKAYSINMQDNYCMFLKNNICTIYEIAPLSCKIKPIAYPWFYNAWKENCIAINKVDNFYETKKVLQDRQLLVDTYGEIDGVTK